MALYVIQGKKVDLAFEEAHEKVTTENVGLLQSLKQLYEEGWQSTR